MRRVCFLYKLKHYEYGKENDTATERQKVVLMGVIDKADLLMEELDAYDELDGDLIQWYYDKYKAQK